MDGLAFRDPWGRAEHTFVHALGMGRPPEAEEGCCRSWWQWQAQWTLAVVRHSSTEKQNPCTFCHHQHLLSLVLWSLLNGTILGVGRHGWLMHGAWQQWERPAPGMAQPPPSLGLHVALHASPKGLTTQENEGSGTASGMAMLFTPARGSLEPNLCALLS